MTALSPSVLAPLTAASRSRPLLHLEGSECALMPAQTDDGDGRDDPECGWWVAAAIFAAGSLYVALLAAVAHH